MPQCEDPLVERDQKPTHLPAPDHVFVNPKIEELSRGDHSVLSLRQGPNRLRCAAIPHPDHHPRRTASNFRAGRQEI